MGAGEGVAVGMEVGVRVGDVVAVADGEAGTLSVAEGEWEGDGEGDGVCCTASSWLHPTATAENPNSRVRIAAKSLDAGTKPSCHSGPAVAKPAGRR